MDFSWRSFAFGFRLLLVFICVELLHYMFMICVLHELDLRLCLDLNIWFVMCDELCWFMLLLSIYFHLVVVRLC